jgi:hypothetical protein
LFLGQKLQVTKIKWDINDKIIKFIYHHSKIIALDIPWNKVKYQFVLKVKIFMLLLKSDFINNVIIST